VTAGFGPLRAAKPVRGLLFATFAFLSVWGAGAQPKPTMAKPKDRPNLVVVLLDDAGVEITESMPRIRSLMIEKGVRFTSSIASTPLCGPSRAVLLTGQYAHNTKVYYNDGAEGGYRAWSKGGSDERNIGPWLQAQGYRTGLFGKYMNDFPNGRPETFVPSGWDDFRGVLSDREARNNRFTLNENGFLRLYEASAGGYQTDVLSARLEAFVRAAARPAGRPFFALLSVSAPHVPPEPADRHLAAFPGDHSPRKPSFDEADLSDKPEALRDQAASLTPMAAREIDATYRAMRQSLLSVEDAMEALLKALTETGEISKTYIFLTSDNGWMRGEHRIPAEKYAPYEESIRVPLIVRGPLIASGRSLNRVVGVVDLVPTLLELAGAPKTAAARSDGRSLVPLLHATDPSRVPWRESILIEHFGGGAPFRVRSYSGMRSENETYVEYVTGEKESYDLVKDPYQMENQAATLSPSALARRSERVKAFKICAAAACRAVEGVSKN
jgi:arylsulfatase A-like enzyme